MKLDNFIHMMTGHFDNKEQFDMMQEAGKSYPYAEHVNTVCNDKIKNIPADFNGKFIVEESYYETNGKRHASPHLFLITENEDGILLSSYEIPGDDKNTFSYDSMKNVDYSELKKSQKFTPALYILESTCTMSTRWRTISCFPEWSSATNRGCISMNGKSASESRTTF